jgi:pyruvate dehydrogenase E1 component alpha subunit
MPGLSLDGNDAVAIFDAMSEPLRRARAGEGPTLIECKTYRHGGHHVNDPGLYMPQDEMQYWKSKDPILVLQEYLHLAGVDDAAVASIDQRVDQAMEAAVEFALTSPDPSLDEFAQEIAFA